MTCKNCHEPIVSGMTTCPNCGAALSGSWQQPLLAAILILFALPFALFGSCSLIFAFEDVRWLLGVVFGFGITYLLFRAVEATKP